MSRLGKFYITTPIYYTNDKAHLGHVFEVIGIDAQARFRRMLGHDVRFLSGTDEHGQKIQNQAASRGVSPQAFVDDLAERFKALWSRLGISNDDFIRTSEPRHHRGVHRMWREVASKAGDLIYRGAYEGWYDSRNEAFLGEKDKRENEDRREQQGLPREDPYVKWTKEPCFFFRLSAYQKEIERLFEERPDFIAPDHHRAQMLNSFVKPGLADLCISRSTISWGIPVPDLPAGAPAEVVYVWFDALTNYLSAIGYGTNDEWTEWWPADVHVVGKDILKFHTIIWPAMLMAAGIELPKQVYGHGFITLRDAGSQQDKKMSKSEGNIVDPEDLVARYGVSAVRYHLMREFNYGGDGAFIEENLRARFNADLANGLGNLVSRTLTLVEKSLGGELPRDVSLEGAGERAVVETVDAAFRDYVELMPRFDYARALTRAWEAQAALDRYINDEKPWALAKDPSQADRLARVLGVAADGIRALSVMAWPFMPETCEEIRRRIGLEPSPLATPWEDHLLWGTLGGRRASKGESLFPRLEKA